MNLKVLADQIGHQLDVPSVPMTFEEASAHFEDASEVVAQRVDARPVFRLHSRFPVDGVLDDAPYE